MEEDMHSTISNAKTNVIAEAFDSSNFTYSSYALNRSRPDGYPSSAKFKGVVQQANGHWGAQIYANHQRIWLGTFKSEMDAAMAYDSAALKLRSGDFHRNFPWTSSTIHEPSFQSHYSTDKILNMIKDGSYPSKFADFLTSEKAEKELHLNLAKVHGNEGFSCKLLFQKELTPSDVGKLNRLVIPKKYAVKYFPYIPENPEENVIGGKVDDVQLVFYDRLMRSWKFRYCYWKSSQSFVFTRGWNRFVKEKELKTNDIVAFYMCEVGEREKEGQAFCIIDVGYKGDSSNNGMAAGFNQNVGLQADLCLRLGQKFNCILVNQEKEDFKDIVPTPNVEKKGVRLFGVQID
ncbi:AP2/ERF and B3 domain-containing transcription factor At1g50680-like [Cornus florida]|uniref:AP2/ERF and B3 domain-containing transcription factor At1g50680-like n=1 Tax=Cornus florida TaxID=4283 RepID=UPI002897DBA2|nr:AP2/ERF and B3 domain-containing transcription factor At1g50680-like [Cornus florida]